MAPDRAVLLRWLRAGLAVLVLVAVGLALARNWDAVSGYLREVSLPTLALALVGALLAPLCTMLGWRVLLADLGSPVPPGPAAGMFFVGQLGKYLPGSVWSVLAQAEIGARLQIPRSRTAVVGLIGIGMAAVTGTLVGLPVLPLAVGARDASGALWVVAVLVPVALVVLWPRVLNAAIATGLRLLRRDPLEHRLSGRAVAVTTAWFLLAWAGAGAQAYVVSRDVAPDAAPAHLVLVSVCGFALASSAGMFSVLLPAGVGVRDGVLALLLATVMPLAAATAVAVLLRFLATVADVVWAAAGWVWARSHHLVSTRTERRARALELRRARAASTDGQGGVS